MSEPTQELDPIDPDLEAGATVGEYEVEGKLGHGAFGVVFKAVHPVIGKVVAIKVLGRKFSVDPEMVSRFKEEARAVNQIRHRHIIDIFSWGKLDDGRQYYVMEYLEGETLDDLIKRHERIPVADALAILRAIGKALDAAHAKGIAHRDLKAENVFIASDADGTGVWPKLLDFGIAKLMAPEDGLKHKTRTGAPMGTPYYMSPEQCRGRDVDHRTDLYAFGVLAYLMLTGVYPHDADDYLAILMKQLTDQPAPPSSIVAELTSDIDDVVLWLMHKDPAQRPADLRTAVRALEEAAGKAGLAEPSPTTSWDAPQTGPISKAYATQPPRTTGVARGSVPPETTAPASVRINNRSRSPMIAALAVLGLGAIATVAFLTLRAGSTTQPAPPAQPPAPVVMPSPPAPTPAPTPAHVVAPTQADEPQTVMITIAGVPEGTEVFAGGMTVGAAPGPVQLPRDAASMVLTFKTEGYLPVSKTVVPDRDQDVRVVMKKKPKSGGGSPRSTREDILDPFGAKK